LTFPLLLVSDWAKYTFCVLFQYFSYVSLSDTGHKMGPTSHEVWQMNAKLELFKSVSKRHKKLKCGGKVINSSVDSF